MLKLGKLTDYGTVLMTALAAEPARLQSAADLAARSHVPEPTVSKLLKRLGRAKLVEAVRGAHGGYRLARAPESITVADVVSALEGPIGFTECSVHKGGCTVEPYCNVRGNWRLISGALRSALESVSLAQMAAPMTTVGAGSSARTAPRSAESVLRFVPQRPPG